MYTNVCAVETCTRNEPRKKRLDEFRYLFPGISLPSQSTIQTVIKEAKENTCSFIKKIISDRVYKRLYEILCSENSVCWFCEAVYSGEADPLLTCFIREFATIRDFTAARHTTIFAIEGSLTSDWRAETLTSVSKPTCEILWWCQYVRILSYTVLKVGVRQYFINLGAASKF
jgi:hypothetical protein